MPALICAATTCVYNSDEYCSKGEIRVGGDSARDSRETCCESFVERREGSMSNSVHSSTGEPQKSINIDCEVCQCVYNDDYKCDAIQVDIAGVSASDAEQTACGTFRHE